MERSRTTLTIEKYYGHLDDPNYCQPVQKPECNSQEHSKRDVTEEEALALAKAYNRKIIDFLSKHFV